MILAPPCPPPTLLVPPLNHLFPSHDFLRNSYSDSNCCHRTVPTRVFCNPIPRAFPRLSLSTPSPIHKRNKESRLLFRKQLQLLCLSALLGPSLETLSSKHSSKSRFLSLALPNSRSDEEPYIKEDEEEEDMATASSSIQKEEQVPAGGSLLLVTELMTQLLSTHVAMSTEFYMRAMNSPAGIGNFYLDGLGLCTFLSAIGAVQRHIFFAQQCQKSGNGPLKSSPQVKGAMSLMTHFYQGVLWGFPGTCLAIMSMRRNSLMIYEEVGFISTIQSILKSLTPGAVFDSESWPLKVSVFYTLSNLLGLVCSMRCYDQRESIQLRAVAKHLALAGLTLLSYIAIRSLVTWLRTLGMV